MNETPENAQPKDFNKVDPENQRPDTQQINEESTNQPVSLVPENSGGSISIVEPPIMHNGQSDPLNYVDANRCGTVRPVLVLRHPPQGSVHIQNLQQQACVTATYIENNSHPTSAAAVSVKMHAV